MRCSLWKLHSGNCFKILLLQSIVLAVMTMFSHRVEASARSRDLVVVIDKSMSMLDEFDSAKAEAKAFLSTAQVGDRVTIITFGNSAQLLERLRVKSSRDMAGILSTIEEIEPTDFSTHLSAGMERSLRELRRFYEENAENERAVLWLSDDKNNPPQDLADLLDFVMLKDLEAAHMPEKAWFAFHAPIKQQESDVDWFVQWANRRETPLSVHLKKDVLEFGSADTQQKVHIEFQSESPAAQGMSFSVVAEAADPSGRFSPIPVIPDMVTCRKTTWQETFLVTFPEEPGRYTCRLSFVLPSDQTLKISPPQVGVRATVHQEIEKAPDAPDPIRAALADAAEKGRRGSLQIDSTGLNHAARIPQNRANPAQPISFGPISPGSRRVARVNLKAEAITPETIDFFLDLRLPSGLILRPKFLASAGGLIAEISVVADEQLLLPSGWEQKGAIRFAATNGIVIDPMEIPVRLFAADHVGRWGQRELVEPPAYEWVDVVAIAIARWFALAVKAALASAVVLAIAYLMKRLMLGGAGLCGTLEILEEESGKTLKSINLRRLGRFKGRNFLTIGGGKKADIPLDQSSVSEIHAKLTAAKTPAGTLLFVQSLSNQPVVVNGTACTRAKELANGDIVGIGSTKLVYRRPEFFKETILCFNDGRLIRGILISWDIESRFFEFLPKGAPSADAFMLIEFSELKWVSFIGGQRGRLMNLFQRKDASASCPAEIIFKDGEVFEGYVLGDLSQWHERFYVVPREHSERSLYLVERSAIQNVFPRVFERTKPGEFLRNLSASLGLLKH